MPSPSPMIRVRPVGDAKLPVPGSAAPRFVGRDRKGAPLIDGALVPDDSYHRRAIARGELEEVPA